MVMPWLEGLNLGIGPLDDEHRHMFELMTELNASLTAGNLSGVRTLLDELCAATLAHFRAEEALMARTCYPRALAHRAEHDRTRHLLMALDGHLASGRVERLEALLGDFADGYFRGVLRDDGLFARFLQEDGQGLASRYPHTCLDLPGHCPV